MNTRIFRFLPPFALATFILGVAACSDPEVATVRITVVEEAIDQISGDTVIEAVPQATVRFYQDERVGTQWLEEIVTTGASGVAEFTFPNPAILKYDVTHNGRSSLENFIILELDETIEDTVNLDEL